MTLTKSATLLRRICYNIIHFLRNTCSCILCCCMVLILAFMAAIEAEDHSFHEQILQNLFAAFAGGAL